jgi:DNA-binding response OmpR family regulator
LPCSPTGRLTCRRAWTDLTERLRHTPATERLPILLISASVQEADISRGFAAGADGYLTKPFTPDQLLTRVRDVLSRGAA